MNNISVCVLVLVLNVGMTVSRSSGAPLLVANLHIHTVVLINLVSALLIIQMCLETATRSVHSVCSRALRGHTLLPCTIDLLAFDNSKVLATINGSMRTKVPTGIYIESIVKTLSDFTNPCLGDIRH